MNDRAEEKSPYEVQQRIAERAYQLFIDRGQVDGYDVNDWLEAERQIRVELTGHLPVSRAAVRRAGPPAIRKLSAPTADALS